MPLFIILSLLLSNLHAFKCESTHHSSIEIGANRGSIGGYLYDDNRNKLDLEDDLNLKQSKNSLIATLKSSLQKHQFRFKMSNYKYSGKKRLSTDILFNSEKFAKATMIQSNYDLKWAKAAYRYEIINGVLFGADLNALRAKTKINQNSLKKNIIIPSVALDYNYDLTHELMLRTKVSLTPYGKNRANDFYAGLAIKLGFSNCSCLNIGYQVSQLKIDTDKLKNSIQYQGVYAGIRVGF